MIKKVNVEGRGGDHGGDQERHLELVVECNDLLAS
jgi:hypothetical protein